MSTYRQLGPPRRLKIDVSAPQLKLALVNNFIWYLEAKYIEPDYQKIGPSLNVQMIIHENIFKIVI